MCGIAGYIGTRRVPDDRALACLGSLRHRGPDGHNLYRHEGHGQHCLLLHTRLAILDLDERSAQPMRLGASILSYNGELYNFVELRRVLESAGYDFRTSGDTEVLLAWWKEYGPEGLDQCEGMWAFALYDEATGVLTLCRDRFGEKPLHLLRTDHGLYFASEAKALATLSGTRLRPNRAHIQRYLVNGYKSLFKGEEGFFQGVRQLPSGHLLQTRGEAEARPRSYWTWRHAPRPDMPYEEAVSGTRDRLVRSVELRLRADVPLAFCMSGGVDSNSLISIARRVFDYDVHGFTVVNSDERYDERELVQAATQELGIKHTAIPVRTSDFLPTLRRLVRRHDGPLGTISYYAHWLLMQAVSEAGCKVSVSGTAADELFTGYYDHQLWYLAALARSPEAHAEALKQWREHVLPVVRNPLLQDPDAFIREPGRRDHLYANASGHADLLASLEAEPFSERAYPGADPLRNRMLNELFHEVIPLILNEDDLNAMDFSIENRSPFLDRDLFEFCQTIPTPHLMGQGYNKKILRDAMRGIVPDAILDCRRKVGFNAPLFGFLDPKDPAARKEILADGPLFEVIRRPGLEGMLDRPHLTNEDSKILFNALNIKFFLEEFAA